MLNPSVSTVEKKKAKYDPTVVGLEESSSDESSESEKEEVSQSAAGEVNEITNNVDDDNDVDDEVKIITNNNDDEKTKPNIELENDKHAISSKASQVNDEVIESDKNDKSGASKVEKKYNGSTLMHPTIHVEVKRDPKVQVARLKLPILGEEQKIMELINENEIVVIAGETGKLLFI